MFLALDKLAHLGLINIIAFTYSSDLSIRFTFVR